jgi:vacuolar-type H+-ATPase subunit E/Vma4
VFLRGQFFSSPFVPLCEVFIRPYPWFEANSSLQFLYTLIEQKPDFPYHKGSVNFMEELQSTDILDREILEDARKKALRILKTADDTALAQTAQWDKKTAAALDELGKKHAEQCRLAEADIMARLPTDKRRAKAEKIENLIRGAVEAWYAGLSREEVLGMLKSELAKRTAQAEEFSKAAGQRRVRASGLDRAEAEAILRSVSGNCVIEEVPSVHGFPEIVLETGNVRVTSSIQKTVDYLLQERRAELIEALLGKDFPEGA